MGAYQFMGLEDFATGCNGDVHHLFVLLQGVEATAHVAMEVVPGQQVLIDGVRIVKSLLLQQQLQISRTANGQWY